MPAIPIWQIVTSLGVAGLAVFIFFLVVRRFGTTKGEGFEVSKLGKRASAGLAFFILIAVTLITLTALVLFAPRGSHALVSIDFGAPDVEDLLPESYSPRTRETLAATIKGIERAVETHNWEAFLLFADPEHREFQRANGVGDGQYIEEALGFGWEHNDLPGEHNPADPFARLDSIERLAVTEVNITDKASVKVSGVVMLKSSKQRPFSFELSQQQLGEFRLSLGWG